MIRALTLVGLCLSTLLLGATQVSARDVDTERLVNIIEVGQEMWQVPGLAVAMIEDGEVILQRGFGKTSQDGPDVDTHTLFGNASTTKAMVSAGIMLLVDEGKLSLDDLVIDYLPELHLHNEVLTQQVTIRDLLAHRTGLPSTDFWTFRQLTPLDEQINLLRRVQPAAAPRSRLIYQNTMYELAGMIIQRQSGQRWDTFLRERLWQPIGMLETYGTRGQIPPDKSFVTAHDVVDNEVQAIPYDLPLDREDAAGSAWSSIHDMTLWAQFLLRGGVTAEGEQLLSAEAIAQIFEPQLLITPDDFYPTYKLTEPNWRSYGLGWYQQDFQGRKIDFHTGSLDGLVAIIGLDRAQQRAVIVMQNMDGSELRHGLLWEAMDTRALTERRNWIQDVFDLYAERAEERQARWDELDRQRIKRSRTSLKLDQYFGRYSNDVLGSISLLRKNGKLILKTGMYEYDVEHWHLDTFLVSYVSWSAGTFAEFRISPKGEVAAMDVFGKTFTRDADEP